MQAAEINVKFSATNDTIQVITNTGITAIIKNVNKQENSKHAYRNQLSKHPAKASVGIYDEEFDLFLPSIKEGAELRGMPYRRYRKMLRRGADKLPVIIIEDASQ